MLKFIVISDIHIVPQNELCNGIDTFERFDLAIDSINSDHPDADFCILAGDLADKGQIESYLRFNEDVWYWCLKWRQQNLTRIHLEYRIGIVLGCML